MPGASFIRLGVFADNSESDTATPGPGNAGAVSFDDAWPHLQGAIAALNAMPRPNAVAIRNIVRSLFNTVSAGYRPWDTLSDEWIAWTVSGWDVMGLSDDAIENVFTAMNVDPTP